MTDMAEQECIVPACRDPEHELPVATAWRDTLEKIVDRLASGDYSLRGCPGVEAVRPGVLSQMGSYIADYGETIVALPKESWDSSVAQWTSGYWDVIVDLWTEESGRSDLVLKVRVLEDSDGYTFQVNGVYVP